MEMAKTGSKLAQLQALRGQKQRRQALGRIVHALHSTPSVITLEAEIKRLKSEVGSLESRNRFLQAQIVALRDVDTTKSKRVASTSKECPVCKARKALRAKAQKKWRSKRKRDAA